MIGEQSILFWAPLVICVLLSVLLLLHLLIYYSRPRKETSQRDEELGSADREQRHRVIVQWSKDALQSAAYAEAK